MQIHKAQLLPTDRDDEMSNQIFWRPRLGAVYLGDNRCLFRVWASTRGRVALHLYEPEDRLVPMAARPLGYFEVTLDGGAEFSDPASRSQPGGVHAPSEVVDPAHPWTDAAWHGLPLDRVIFYEMHVGTFTPAGAFPSAIDRLDELVKLGVTAVELMPVAQFAGARGLGYDGVYLFAPQASYGGPAGLKAFVDSCHVRRRTPPCGAPVGTKSRGTSTRHCCRCAKRRRRCGSRTRTGCA